MRKHHILVVGAIVAVLIVLVAVPLLILQSNADALRPMVASRLEGATGREVTIGGDFDIALSLVPSVAAGDVRVANASWASDGPMIEAERLVVAIDLIALVRGLGVQIQSVSLEKATVRLERGAGGRGNWQFGDGGGGESPLLLDEVSILDTRLLWHDRVNGRQENVEIERATVSTGGGEEPAEVDAQGRYRERPWRIAGTLGAIGASWGWAGAHPVELNAAIGDLRVQAAGEIALDASAATDGLKISVEGQRVAALGELIGRPLPEFGPYAGSLHLRRTGEGGWWADELTAIIGPPEGMQLQATGRIGDLAALGGIDLRVVATGPEARALADRFDLPIPAEGRFRISAALTGSLDRLALSELEGELGTGGGATVVIDSGRIEQVMPLRGLEIALRASGRSLAHLNALAPVALPAAGAYQAAFVLHGEGKAFRVSDLEASLAANGAEASLTGAINQLAPVRALRLDVALEAPSLKVLGPMVGAPLPESPKFAMTARLVDLQEGGYRLDDLNATLGKSDVGGALRFDFAVEPPLLIGELRSRRLVVEELLALGENDEAEPGATAAAEDAGAGSMPLPVDLLRQAQGRIDWRAEEVIAADEDLSNVAVQLRLQEGRLSARPFVLHIADGRVEGEASMAARGAEATLQLDASAEDIDLRDLLTTWAGVEGVEGRASTVVRLQGTGGSLREVVSDLQGRARLVVEQGSMEDDQLHRMVQDMDLFAVLFRRPEQVTVNCLVGRISLQDGEGSSTAMLDTQRMTLAGRGTVDLDTGAIRGELVPQAKHARLSTLAVPVEIAGSLADPRIEPRGDIAAAQAVRGVIGGLLVPLNVVSALFGAAEADACKAALQETDQGVPPALPAEVPQTAEVPDGAEREPRAQQEAAPR